MKMLYTKKIKKTAEKLLWFWHECVAESERNIFDVCVHGVGCETPVRAPITRKRFQ